MRRLIRDITGLLGRTRPARRTPAGKKVRKVAGKATGATRVAPKLAAPKALGSPRSSGAQAASSKRLAPGEAFTPSRPKTGKRKLVGRQAELRRILSAMTDERAHVVLFAERGRGKTTLANLAVESMRASGVIVARFTCDNETTFDVLIRGLARNLPVSLLGPSSARSTGEGCEAVLPDATLRPQDVVAIPGRLTCNKLVFVVDEFDRVENANTRTRLADTIKQISDRDIGLSFLIVGVSDNLEQIIGQHPSIQRNIVPVALTLLGDSDVKDLIVRGGRETGTPFAEDVEREIVRLARGMPHMAQLLGLRVTQAAQGRSATEASMDDLRGAVEVVVADADPRATELYSRLTCSGEDPDMLATLRAVAFADQDSVGRLRAFKQADGAMLVGSARISADNWQRLCEVGVVTAIHGPEAGLFQVGQRGLMQQVTLRTFLLGHAVSTPPSPGEAGGLPHASRLASAPVVS